MTEIDYANARPIDVHRWSEYPEVNDSDDSCWVSPPRSLKIAQLSDVACADALNPTIGSNTRKLSINWIKATKVTNGIKCGTMT